MNILRLAMKYAPKKQKILKKINNYDNKISKEVNITQKIIINAINYQKGKDFRLKKNIRMGKL